MIAFAERPHDDKLKDLGFLARKESLNAKSRLDEEKIWGEMARLAGIEPATLGFGGQYSIH
jgi:hypothetical protein